MSLLAVSFNRYLHVCHSKLYYRIVNKRRTIITCAALWVILAIPALPPLFGKGAYVYMPEYHICSYSRKKIFTHPKPYIIFMNVVVVCLVVHCNFRIFRFWRTTRDNLLKHGANRHRQNLNLAQRKLETMNAQGCSSLKSDERRFGEDVKEMNCKRDGAGTGQADFPELTVSVTSLRLSELDSRSDWIPFNSCQYSSHQRLEPSDTLEEDIAVQENEQVIKVDNSAIPTVDELKQETNPPTEMENCPTPKEAPRNSTPKKKKQGSSNPRQKTQKKCKSDTEQYVRPTDIENLDTNPSVKTQQSEDKTQGNVTDAFRRISSIVDMSPSGLKHALESLNKQEKYPGKTPIGTAKSQQNINLVHEKESNPQTPNRYTLYTIHEINAETSKLSVRSKSQQSIKNATSGTNLPTQESCNITSSVDSTKEAEKEPGPMPDTECKTGAEHVNHPQASENLQRSGERIAPMDLPNAQSAPAADNLEELAKNVGKKSVRMSLPSADDRPKMGAVWQKRGTVANDDLDRLSVGSASSTRSRASSYASYMAGELSFRELVTLFVREVLPSFFCHRGQGSMYSLYTINSEGSRRSSFSSNTVKQKWRESARKVRERGLVRALLIVVVMTALSIVPYVITTILIPLIYMPAEVVISCLLFLYLNNSFSWIVYVFMIASVRQRYADNLRRLCRSVRLCCSRNVPGDASSPAPPQRIGMD